MDLDRRELRRAAASACYLGFARHLPWGPRPGGALAKRLRRALAKHMLDECGVMVNVEHGAWFGSGRGIRLGDHSDLGMDCLVIGPLHVGRDVMIGPRCTFLGSSHETSDPTRPMRTQGFKPDDPVVIGNDVFIGAGSTILAGRKVGDGSIVAAGSVVTRDVPPGTVVGGNPARPVATRRPDDAAQRPVPGPS